MGSTTPDTVSAAERLEAHLCREFVQNYLRGKRTINPNALFMAARFSGLKISTRTLERVLTELTRQ
jgi:hypothetical protein